MSGVLRKEGFGGMGLAAVYKVCPECDGYSNACPLCVDSDVEGYLVFDLDAALAKAHAEGERKAYRDVEGEGARIWEQYGSIQRRGPGNTVWNYNQGFGLGADRVRAYAANKAKALDA